MSVSVSMPQLGESVTEGTVTRWLKKEGEHVTADEPLLEVSTDKVDTEIPSPASGILRGIAVDEDETVAVGAQLAVIEDSAAAPVFEAPAPAPAPAPAAPVFEAPVAEAPGDKPGRVLGVHLVGSRVGELIAEAQLIVNWDAEPDDVASLIHPHPTQSEIIGEAHLALAGKPLHFHA